jgi:hypothetical protein
MISPAVVTAIVCLSQTRNPNAAMHSGMIASPGIIYDVAYITAYNTVEKRLWR